MKFVISAAALLALAVPAASLAADAGSPSAEQLCRAQRTQMGADLFKQTYGTNKNKSNAFGKCVSKASKTQDANDASASKTCKAEQADANFAASHGGKTFAQFYGTGKKGANAFGKCVSSKSNAADAADNKATVNAAKTCKAAKKADPAKFATDWGTKRNAFGKCVSATAKAKS